MLIPIDKKAVVKILMCLSLGIYLWVKYNWVFH